MATLPLIRSASGTWCGHLPRSLRIRTLLSLRKRIPLSPGPLWRKTRKTGASEGFCGENPERKPAASSTAVERTPLGRSRKGRIGGACTVALRVGMNQGLWGSEGRRKGVCRALRGPFVPLLHNQPGYCMVPFPRVIRATGANGSPECSASAAPRPVALRACAERAPKTPPPNPRIR